MRSTFTPRFELLAVLPIAAIPSFGESNGIINNVWGLTINIWGQLCLNITCDISISFLMIFPPSLIDDFLVKFCCFILFPAVYCTSELSLNMLAQCPYSWLNRHISSPSYWQWSNQLIFGCLTTCKYENVGYFHVVQMVCLNVYAHDMLCQIGRRQHDQPSWSSRKKARVPPFRKLGTNHQWRILTKFTKRWMGWEATYDIWFHSNINMKGENNLMDDSFISMIYPLVF